MASLKIYVRNGMHPAPVRRGLSAEQLASAPCWENQLTKRKNAPRPDDGSFAAQPHEHQNKKCIQCSCRPAKPVECTSPDGKRYDNTSCTVREDETPNHRVTQCAGWNVAPKPGDDCQA